MATLSRTQAFEVDYLSSPTPGYAAPGCRFKLFLLAGISSFFTPCHSRHVSDEFFTHGSALSRAESLELGFEVLRDLLDYQ